MDKKREVLLVGGMDGIIEFSLTMPSALSKSDAAECRTNSLSKGLKRLNKRTKHALKLRQKGLSFNQIGQDLGIGSERARQIVRKHQSHLEVAGGSFCAEN